MPKREEQFPDPTGLYFYGGPFSNFEGGPIDVDGLRYPTVEHYFHSQKPLDPPTREYIRCSPDPAVAKARGQRVRLRDDWPDVRYAVMLTGLRAKFAIPAFRRALMATGDRNIYEDSPTDFIWGFRSADRRNTGLNLLGKALMQVRSEIRGSR